MQVTINSINAASKEVLITVEPERVQKYYQKYLTKAAKDLDVPGFRKGKAPLSMVERLYADKIEDYFQKEVVDEVFTEASKEHNIEYLLYPEVKDIQWEKGNPMEIKIEIEIEPDVEFANLENLKVAYKPLLLEDEVDRYIEQLRNDNATMVDVETSIEEDEMACEISIEIDGIAQSFNFTLYAGETKPFRSYPELVGKKTGDVVDVNLNGKLLIYGFKELQGNVDPETEYPAKVMVNSVMRRQVPALDDEFAKDMEFDNLEAMKAKIAEDMKLKNEHMNINIKNNSVIGQLFNDNKFELPMRTLEYLAQQQVQSITDENMKSYYLYQERMHIAQEMVSIYVVRNLRKVMKPEITEEDKLQYMTHEAILSDKTLEAWKEANKSIIEAEDFTETVENYVMLCNLAAKCEYYEPQPEEETPEAAEAPIQEAGEDTQATQE